jgi:hypothetical protein
MRTIHALFISFIFITLFSQAVMANKASETLFIGAQGLFERSLAGDDSVTAVALNQFKILSMTYPNQPLFLAYVGACYALMAREAWMPWNKSSYVEKGLTRIDNALTMLKGVHDHEKMRGAPISVETRFIAVSTFSNVPKSFNYFEKAKAVLNDLLESGAFNQTPVSLQARIYLTAAKIAQEEGDRVQEIAYLRKVSQVEPSGEFAEEAQERLQVLDK